MGTFRLKSVADKLGVSPHTLRAWEKRYGAVKPGRSESGRRVYSEEEVERLVLLGELVRQGHSISQIAQLSDQKLSALKGQPDQPALAQFHFFEMLSALHDFNVEALAYHLNWASFSLSCREFVYEIAVPLMREVGELVLSEKMSISQEHTLSSLLRTYFSRALEVLQSHQKALGNPKTQSVILTTPEGDQHEFGILLSAALCAHFGVPAYYLGPSTPAQEIVETVHRLKNAVVVLGNLPHEDAEKKKHLEQFFQHLDRELPPEVEVWVGGGEPPHWEFSKKGSRFLFLKSLAFFEEKLVQWQQTIKTKPSGT